MMSPSLLIPGLVGFLGSALFSAANNWTHWRGPLQNGSSLEHYEKHAIEEKPLWTVDLAGQGTPLIVDGKVFVFGYRGEFDDLVETLTCLDGATGELVWEKNFRDFISDTAYNRYAIGSPAYDAETGNIYLQTSNGVFACCEAKTGEIKWAYSLMEMIGRLTFPNGRTGAPIIEGDTVIVHVITANWGAAGPAQDRLYAFDKKSGDLVWFTGGGMPPRDSSHSTPFVETRYGRRVMFIGMGDGNLSAFNARTGEPLFRFQLSKMGIGCSPVVADGVLMGIHNDENVDTSDSGRMVGVKLPADIPPKQADPTKTDPTQLPVAAEAWRVAVGSFTSSPTVSNGRVYQLTNTGNLECVEIATGNVLAELKLGEDNLHSSPLFVDGLLYCPVKGGARASGGATGYLHIVKPTKNGAEAVKMIELEGEANAQPAVADGKLFVHTRHKLYCFKIGSGKITVDKAPAEPVLKPGKAVALRIVPQEVTLQPGQKATFRLASMDANGLVVAEVKEAKWESFIPPTARVKSTADATFAANGELTAGEKISAGAFKATSPDGLSGVIRCRVMPAQAQQQDFEAFEIAETHATEGVKFAYPPLPWMGARFKWEVREQDGSKVLAKTLDQIFFQRAMTFIGREDRKNYTVQADLMTEGTRRLKSEIGLINQRYLITLKGNENAISVSSNYERLNVSTPFPVKANTWYTLKTSVVPKPDGSTLIFAKAWERGQPEPEKWSFEHVHKDGHRNGSPGLFGFSPQSQKRVFIDNIVVKPNE
ncbi:MAG: PQQ-binding-like beta-propeller repeat protein [Verrucomicrobiales bacterium]